MTREEQLYAAVVERSAAERYAFLDHECGDDAALRARVEALLAANEEAEHFFAISPIPRPVLVPEEKPGDRIGRYKLLQKIGEGGCGVVYMAEQEEPVHRRVALKVIKLGMDTKTVIARFEAERQALALMEHPNIARVLDAGATETGRPFFVMELVRGIPITRHCDAENLTTRARLGLFLQVCHAIQHAHEKGVVHRDIKPSNILVTMHDDVAVPKVIDFGIAKATQGRLTDKTVFTAFEQFIGTPAYMSPEQAQMNDLEVDTRSDIYSLGVLLYELLTGRPPFDPRTLQQSGIDEIRRIIREVDPPKPSTRLDTLTDDDRAAVAQRRGIAPAQLSTLVRGDLDWIAMKALEKNRARRYETAHALGDDIKRHLTSEPVRARPPSAGYRLQKFAARHRFGLSASAAVVTALGAGLTLSHMVWTGKPAQEPPRSTARTPATPGPGQTADASAVNAPPVRAEPTLVGATTSSPNALTVRQVPMAKFPGTWGASCVSPDGRYFIYGSEGNQFMLVEAATGTLRKLVKANRGVCFAGSSTQVAVIDGTREQGYELRVVNLDGTLVRTVAKFTDETWLQAWSPDGRQFAVISSRDRQNALTLVEADQGTSRVVRTTGAREPGRVAFSPDSRWLTYDVAVDEKGMNSDLLLIDLSNGRESTLVQHKADDRLLGWSPHSGAILFTSNRRGNYDAWTITCVEGKAVGEPTLVKRDLGEPEPIGFTANGAFYYAHREWVEDVFAVPLDKATGRATGPAVKAVDRFEGTNSAANWSPDGAKLAYSSRQPPFLIRLLDPTTQEDHIIAEGFYGPKWSPNGKALLCFSQWDGEEKKLHLVDVASGSHTMIDDGKPAGRLFRAYQWAPDGRSIYYQYTQAPHVATIVRRDLATGQEQEIQRVEDGGFFAISPDGTTLVFRKKSDLYLAPLAGGEPKPLYAVPKGHYTPGWDVFTWSADGRAVFVCVWQIHREAEQLSENITSELVQVPIDGGKPETVLARKRVRYPHAHPDGTRLTFSAGAPRLELWVMENFLPADTTASSLQRMGVPPNPESANPPSPLVTIKQVPLAISAQWIMAMSDDGRYVAFQPNGTNDLAVHELATRQTKTIFQGTKERYRDSGAVFSPDGQRIAYEVDGTTLHIAKIDGAESRQVYDRRGNAEEEWTEPQGWSEDGAELIVGSWFKSAGPRLFRLHLQSGRQTEIARLSSVPAPDGLTLSPDRRYIARRQGNYPRMIVLHDLQTGGAETLLARDADRVLGWVPGESALVYSKNRGVGLDLWAMEVRAGKLGEPELLWSNWAEGNSYTLGITRDRSIYYALRKPRPEAHELWVMQGFLKPHVPPTEAWRIQMEIPPEEILAPNSGILDRKLGLAAAYPTGWTVSQAVRQGSGGNVIAFRVPGIRNSRTRIIYWPATPWENPQNPVQDYGKAGPKPTTPAEIDTWMRRRVRMLSETRAQGEGYTNYRSDPQGRVSRTVNGQPALSFSAEFTRGDQPWVEHGTFIYGEKTMASVSMQVPAAQFDGVKDAFEELVTSLRLP